jgi:Na+/proline symporter/signal transduction histidine kinase
MEINIMQLNIDSTIFLIFLVFNLAAGIFFGRGIKNIKEYAVGDRNFSTMVIAATLIATWVSGSSFFTDLSNSYAHGLYYIWAIMGTFISFLIVAWVFAPRLGEFLGKISIAEVMGDLFGKKVRIVTAISGCVGVAGIMAAQLKVSGFLFEYAFDVSHSYGVIIGAVIIAIYTSIGGVKSVTLTDVIQLFTFGTIIPTLVFFVFKNLDNIEMVSHTIKHSEMFNYNEIFDFTRPKSLSYLFLFLYMVMPGFEPRLFQRVLMAQNTSQIRNSFTIAAIACFVLFIVVTAIGILVLVTKPGLSSSEVARHVIFDYSYVGLKGITLIGIMAMVMSTIDSIINSTAVLFVHDFIRPLGIKFAKNELTESRIVSILLTIGALMLALSGDNLLKLVIAASSFYLPIVTVPFVMAVLGFRSSSRSVLIGMAAGFITVVSWMIFLPDLDIDALVPGVFANLLFLIGSHYLLNQHGGWVGIKDNAPLEELRKNRQARNARYINNIRNFQFFEFFKNNTPTQEITYLYVSLFCMLTIFVGLYALPNEIRIYYGEIIDVIFPSSVFITTALLSYPLWPKILKDKMCVVIVWNITIFYVLICTGFMFVILNNFASSQIVIFMINLIILAVIMKWRLALLMMITGVFITTKIFKLYMGSSVLTESLVSFKFEVSYAILLVSAILIAFFKPQQDRLELADVKMHLLDGQLYEMSDEVRRSLKVKSDFLNNISHEVRTPLTGILTIGQILHESYDDLSEKQRRDAVKNIAESSNRLHSLMENILDLSKLSSMQYQLDRNSINISDLLIASAVVCKKLYLKDKNIEFITNIKPGIVISCDGHYMKSIFDNLIINAINYSEFGRITISLKVEEGKIKIIVKDEGIGIAKSELYNIFDAFVVGSKTYTPSDGRGIGLTLCKKAVELHGGRIYAESDGIKGATFIVELPLVTL